MFTHFPIATISFELKMQKENENIEIKTIKYNVKWNESTE